MKLILSSVIFALTACSSGGKSTVTSEQSKNYAYKMAGEFCTRKAGLKFGTAEYDNCMARQLGYKESPTYQSNLSSKESENLKYQQAVATCYASGLTKGSPVYEQCIINLSGAARPSIKSDVVSKNQANSDSNLESAKTKCLDLGFKSTTEGFGKCVLRLSK